MYLRPTTLDQACASLAAAPTRILSGGTDVFPALVGRPTPERVLDVSRLPELGGIRQDEGGIRIGARATWSEIRRAELPAAFDALKAAAREVGSVQIQNVATLAGNLCNASPAADGVPPLLVLDAEVELASLAGTRRLTLAEFLKGNRVTARRDDEIMTAIVVPRAAGRSAFLKLGSRRYLVISIAMVAVRLATDGDGRVAEAAVAIGSCSAVARRLPALEAALAGEACEPGLGGLADAAHLGELSPIDDLRASAAYRCDAGLELVRRAVDLCAGAA